MEAQDITGTGTYALFLKLAANNVPHRPVFLKRGQRKKVGRHSWFVHFVECKEGCRSVLFHTKCLVCIDEIGG
jgi:hypothetical protein